jgi:SAM-dependent methyltransferase
MDYDAELRLQNDALRRACKVQRNDRVLDIGCGAGQTTREAARIAEAGTALGVDISDAMIMRARERAEAEGLRNVTFEQADAQVRRFPSEQFDVVISRFGTMFFADPIAAFSNLRRALRPSGRLVMMVWQNSDSNEWSVAIQQCLASPEAAAIVVPPSLDPFLLSNPKLVTNILSAAGFARTMFTDVRAPVYYGEDTAAALAWVRGFWFIRETLQRLDAASAERAVERLRATLAAHEKPTGVWFDSRAWIVTAEKPA